MDANCITVTYILCKLICVSVLFALRLNFFGLISGYDIHF